MKKPEQPYPPHDWEYNQEYTEETIFYIDYTTDEDLEEIDYMENWKDQNDWKEGEPLPTMPEILGYENEICSLNDLLSKCPAGIDPSNVFIYINRDRMMSQVDFSVKIRKPTNKSVLKDAYNKAFKEFKIKNTQYQKDLSIYNEWLAQEEIKKKQKEIRDLKDQLAKLKK
jgi:hypothetical protein